MGEAKRRKQLLGDRYGKKQEALTDDGFSPILIEQYGTSEGWETIHINADVQGLQIAPRQILMPSIDWSDDINKMSLKGQILAGMILVCMDIPFYGLEPKDQENAYKKISDFHETNFFSELYGLCRINPHPSKQPFNAARLVLFISLLSLITSHVSFDNAQRSAFLIRESGKLLYEADGVAGLRDNLIWSFIPEKFHSSVKQCFAGITND